jgi:hypothetical protein
MSIRLDLLRRILVGASPVRDQVPACLSVESHALAFRPSLSLDQQPKVRLRQVLIMLGSHVTMPGKIMHRASPNIISRTNGVDDL